MHGFRCMMEDRRTGCLVGENDNVLVSPVRCIKSHHPHNASNPMMCMASRLDRLPCHPSCVFPLSGLTLQPSRDDIKGVQDEHCDGPCCTSSYGVLPEWRRTFGKHP